MKKINQRHHNPTIGEIHNITKTEPLIHLLAERMTHNLYNLNRYEVPFDENPLKDALIDNMYKRILRAAKIAAESCDLSNAEYNNWTKL